jgi:flagellar basal body-associated protein FliL
MNSIKAITGTESKSRAVIILCMILVAIIVVCYLIVWMITCVRTGQLLPVDLPETLIGTFLVGGSVPYGMNKATEAYTNTPDINAVSVKDSEILP